MSQLKRVIARPRSRDDLDRELEWERCLLESLRLTASNQARHLVEPSGLELYGAQIDEIIAWILETPEFRAHASRRGFEVTATEMKLLRHSTEYAFLILLSQSDPAGVIRKRLSEARGASQAWADAAPLALDGQSRHWLISHVMWLFASWVLDEVIDSNLQVDPSIYAATAQVLIELWDPRFLRSGMQEVGQQKIDALGSLWESHGVGEQHAQLISTSMVAFLMCHQNLARAGFSARESHLVCEWTTGYLDSLLSVRETLHSLASSRCSFEQFVTARQPNTAIDLPILFLLLWHGRALGVSPHRICRLASELHPTQGNYRGWMRDAMIISGIGNDLVDVERDLQAGSMNTVLCVYGEMYGKSPFDGPALDAEGVRRAYRDVAGRLNHMLEALALDFREEHEAVEQRQSALFHTRAELLAAVTALVDTCFATVYSGFVCARYREGATALIDALSASGA
jgi:hypothetical protein